jgi:hypothetical protein
VSRVLACTSYNLASFFGQCHVCRFFSSRCLRFCGIHIQSPAEDHVHQPGQSLVPPVQATVLRLQKHVEMRTKWVSQSALFLFLNGFSKHNCSLIMRYYQTGVTFDLFLLRALMSSTSGWKSCSAPSTCHTCPWVAQQAEHEAEWKAAESDFNTQEIEQTWNMTWTHFSRSGVEGISKQSHSERLMIDRALYMHTHWISCKQTGQEDILGYFPGKCIRSSCSSMSALDAQPIAWLQQGFRSQTVFRCF